jgi:hypothetical protein
MPAVLSSKHIIKMRINHHGRMIPLLVFVGMTLFGLRVFSAEAPINDRCSGAIVIPSGGTFPYKTPIVSLRDATREGDPSPSCFEVTRGVWYRFAPNQSGLYSFSTGFDTATTALDTVLSIFTSANGCAAATNEVACNDDAGAANNRAGLITSLTAGTEYYILLSITSADEGDTNQPLSVELRVDKPSIPGNDSCATAEVVPTTGPFPHKTQISETVVAVTESGTPPSSCIAGQRSVWYRFVPAATGIYILSNGQETGTTVFDTVMTLYSSSSQCVGLTEIACNDNGEGRGGIFRTLDAGVTYYISVSDVSPSPIISETLVQLSVAMATAPSVSTLPFSSIASTGAVLVGTVNPNGLQSRFWFEWGTTTTYGSTSQVRLLLPGTATFTTNAMVAGFAPNVTYHYRMVATNTLGRVTGADQTFVWSASRPFLIGSTASQSSSYRLAFSANPKQVYLIETSANLVNWSTLGTAAESPIGSGNFIFTHVGGLGLPSRLYRVKSP